MDKKTIATFTNIAISCIILKAIPIILSYAGATTIFTSLISVLGLISFHVLLFYVAGDLKQHYKKDVWPIYLFSCYSVLMSFVLTKGTTQNNTQLMLLIMGILTVIFSVFMMRTVYRIFGIVYILVYTFTVILHSLGRAYFSIDQMIFLSYIGYLPVFYPLLLVYIVKAKAKNFQQEIESIGIEIVSAKDTSANNQLTRRTEH